MKKSPAILFLLPILLLLLTGSSPARTALSISQGTYLRGTTLTDTLRTASPQRNADGLAANSGSSVAASSRIAANPVTDLSLDDLVPPAPSAME
ncbi:MAG: hypothetical protein ACI399_08150, partial [Candidatus Cryptobacteroides sp.]